MRFFLIYWMYCRAIHGPFYIIRILLWKWHLHLHVLGLHLSDIIEDNITIIIVSALTILLATHHIYSMFLYMLRYILHYIYLYMCILHELLLLTLYVWYYFLFNVIKIQIHYMEILHWIILFLLTKSLSFHNF